MLWAEGEVYPNKYKKELSFTSACMEGKAIEKGKSVGESGEDSEDGSHSKNIVKVGGHVVCIMKYYVKG